MRNREPNDLSRILLGDGEDATNRVCLGRSGASLARADQFFPVLVLGPQRSGKTSSIVIPSVLEWNGPSIVTSVRYDVVEATVRHREKMGKVCVFDPSGLLDGTELSRYSRGWNPISSVKTWDDAVALAMGFAEGGPSLAGIQNGEFWVTKAKQLLSVLLFAAATAGQSIHKVAEWCSMSSYTLAQDLEEILQDATQGDFGETLEWQSREYTDEGADTATDALRDGVNGQIRWALSRVELYRNMAETTYSGITATASSFLEAYEYYSVSKRALESELDLAEFFSGEPNTLYLCAPVREQRLYRPIFTAMVRDVLGRIYRHNTVVTDPTKRIPLLACLDEAGNVARLEELDVYATTAAGTGIQLISIFHDMSQLEAAYGPVRANQIVNNHAALLCLPSMRDHATATYFVELLGSQDVRGQDHRGWEYGDLREMEQNRILCLYMNLPPAIIYQRRWYDDLKLSAVASQK